MCTGTAALSFCLLMLKNQNFTCVGVGLAKCPEGSGLP